MEEWELPAPPADYPFAAPEYLYASRREGDPAPAPADDAAAPEEAPRSPTMVWSAATSTWVPAPVDAPPEQARPDGTQSGGEQPGRARPPAEPPPASPVATASPPPSEAPAASPDPPGMRDRTKRHSGGSRGGRPSAGAMRRTRQERRARQEQLARQTAPQARARARERAWTVPPTIPDKARPDRPPLLLLLAIGALCAIVAGIFVVGYRHSPRVGGAAGGSTAGRPTAAATGPRLGDLLGAQASALQRGDEKGFLAAVDPLATATVATYRRIFTNLRAMHVSQFGQGSPDGDTVVDLPDHHPVDVSFCLGDIDYCSPLRVRFDVTVERRGTNALIESVDFVDSGWNDPKAPLPWEVSDLTVRVERGLVVAASPATAARLPALLPVIEKAATVAHEYAVLTMVPDLYTVYVGDDNDRATWFGGASAGAARTVSGFGDFYPAIMVVFPEASTPGPLGGDGLVATVRAALARATLYDSVYGAPYQDTFAAGMVAYAAYHQNPGADKDAVAAATAYVRSGQWDGHCYVDYTHGTADLAAAAPGLGYLAIGYLVSRYGFGKTLDFWGDIERSANNLNTSSIGEFGPGWPPVDAACAAYIRGVARG